MFDSYSCFEAIKTVAYICMKDAGYNMRNKLEIDFKYHIGDVSISYEATCHHKPKHLSILQESIFYEK